MLDDVPPLAEGGIPGFDMSSWHTIATRSGVPRDIVEKLAAAIREGLEEPEVAKMLARDGAIPVKSPPPDELRRFVDSETVRWGKVIEGRRGLRSVGTGVYLNSSDLMITGTALVSSIRLADVDKVELLELHAVERDHMRAGRGLVADDAAEALATSPSISSTIGSPAAMVFGSAAAIPAATAYSRACEGSPCQGKASARGAVPSAMSGVEALPHGVVTAAASTVCGRSKVQATTGRFCTGRSSGC